VTTHVSASVQTGEPTNLAHQCDPIGLTAEAGGFARPDHGLTTVVTARGERPVVKMSEQSPEERFAFQNLSKGLVFS